MRKLYSFLILCLVLLLFSNCKNTADTPPKKAPIGMIWIPGGTFMQGAIPEDQQAMAHEKPQHKVTVDGFFMDITEVTNAQFKQFIDATNYSTVAERAIDWNTLKKQLPKGTKKPHDSLLQPGSLVFKKTVKSLPNLYDFSQWWKWEINANWKQPHGEGSSINNKENYPVVHITYEDALAYCKWANRRLPTEAEWEYAARGDQKNTLFFWGNDEALLFKNANSWEGEFPVTNTKKDGFEALAPVKSFHPNSFGLYDMAGNVWELTSDWYNTNYYNEINQQQLTLKNPKGASIAYSPTNPYLQEKIIKGGSFLCNASYCASYRLSARMGVSLDSSLEHVGFRTVATINMVKKN